MLWIGWGRNLLWFLSGMIWGHVIEQSLRVYRLKRDLKKLTQNRDEAVVRARIEGISVEEAATRIVFDDIYKG